jgi:virulence factor Mce-like protein
MVRRIVTVTVILGACIAAVVLTGATDENVGKVYRAEFDNAFGLSEGGDLRIGGVNAGQTTTFSLSDSEPIKAVVEFEISEPGFDSLREDTRCEIRQQSLIGEYYVDCQPGTSEQELPEGATIPVERTASVIPTDLVNNVLREPYRERLRLIIAELGTGLAGRPEDLAETIQRAHPGLRETNEVLRILGAQTDVLRNFVEDSDDVIDDLAANRADVVRFVQEAGETAEITATRREELAQQFERLPTFLAELDPTMVRLGQLADAQIPLLADLRQASGELETFFARLGPFAQASRPAVRTLGDTSVTGRRAIRESANEIRELKQVAQGADRAGKPLRQFLQTLDDRDRAITTDRRAAFTDPPSFDRESLGNRTNRDIRKARGFTGFEALMNFAFWQTLTTNSFDGVSHFLRILGVVDESENGCSPYGTGEPDRATIDRCNSYLGPNQPGVENATGVVGGGNQGPAKDLGRADPDFTGDRGGAGGASAQSSRSEQRATAQADGADESRGAAAKGQAPAGPEAGRQDLPDGAQSMINRARRDAAGGGDGPAERAGKAAPSARGAADEPVPDTGVESQGGGASSEELLNFLLGP